MAVIAILLVHFYQDLPYKSPVLDWIVLSVISVAVFLIALTTIINIWI
jgi:hypothetical protein